MTIGNWVQTHKPAFLMATGFLMTAALVSAVRERVTKGKNTGLIIFGVSFLTTVALLIYSRIGAGE